MDKYKVVNCVSAVHFQERLNSLAVKGYQVLFFNKTEDGYHAIMIYSPIPTNFSLN